MWIILLLLIKVVCCVKKVSVIYGGDTTFAGIGDYQVRNGKCSYNESFAQIRDEFRKADLRIVNLESPYGDPMKRIQIISEKKQSPFLLSHRDSVQALSYLGIDAVTLSNNHFMDYGALASNQTVDILNKNHIKYAGVTHKMFSKQEAVIMNVNGIKIGLLGYCMTTSGCSEEIREMAPIGYALFDRKLARREAKTLKKVVDCIIVYLHGGFEQQGLPGSPGVQTQLFETLHPYVDVIVNSHQHTVSGTYYREGMLIMTGIGNFLFPMHFTVNSKFVYMKNSPKPNDLEKAEKEWYKVTKKYKNRSAFGMIAKLVFNKNGLVKNETKYRLIEIDVNKKHCMFTKVKPGSKWTTICSKEDKLCLGTSKCNFDKCQV